jgi:hypothetical protein
VKNVRIPQRLSFVEYRARAFEHGQLSLRVLVTRTRRRLHAVQPSLNRPEIRERKLELDHIAISHGIDGTHHVRNVRVLEAAHDLNDRVGLTNM